jgi:hypothetical protein
VPASSIAPDVVKIVGRIGRTPLKILIVLAPLVAHRAL